MAYSGPRKMSGAVSLLSMHHSSVCPWGHGYYMEVRGHEWTWSGHWYVCAGFSGAGSPAQHQARAVRRTQSHLGPQPRLPTFHLAGTAVTVAAAQDRNVVWGGTASVCVKRLLHNGSQSFWPGKLMCTLTGRRRQL